MTLSSFNIVMNDKAKKLQNMFPRPLMFEKPFKKSKQSSNDYLSQVSYLKLKYQIS